MQTKYQNILTSCHQPASLHFLAPPDLLLQPRGQVKERESSRLLHQQIVMRMMMAMMVRMMMMTPKGDFVVYGPPKKTQCLVEIPKFRDSMAPLLPK